MNKESWQCICGHEHKGSHECLADLDRIRRITMVMEADFEMLNDVLLKCLRCRVVNGRHSHLWREALQTLEGFFPMAAAEAPSANGTDAIAVLDWKSGYSQDSHRYQLMAYSDAARETFGMPSSGYITAVEVWLRLGVYEIHHFTADQLNHFRPYNEKLHRLEQLQKQIQRSDDGKADATPGAWCNFCPAQLECKQHEATRMVVEVIGRAVSG